MTTPLSITPLLTRVQNLPGIGASLSKYLSIVAGERVIDLLWHVPEKLLDRTNESTLSTVKDGEITTLRLSIGAHNPGIGKRPYTIQAYDGTGTVELTFFKGQKSYLQKILPSGEERLVQGSVTIFRGHIQLSHPDHVVPLSEKDSILGMHPVYGLTANLTQKTIRKAIQNALKRVAPLPEWLPQRLLDNQQWPAWDVALHKLHTPQSESDLSPLSPHRSRLAFDELMAYQLGLLISRRLYQNQGGRSFNIDDAYLTHITQTLPFELTPDQCTAVADIRADMHAPKRMLRLLQGDVGSGKTVVAFCAMVIAASHKGAPAQAALMAPTEILAQQHFTTIQSLCEPHGLKCALLTGSVKGKKREAILAGLVKGDYDFLIGTHALFQPDVSFQNLGLVIIDEQHRFGVEQRLSLSRKGDKTDTLLMTATPIPRTLIMTLYGDLQVTTLKTKPKNRQPIETRVISVDTQLDSLIAGLQRVLDKNEKIYWVCPLIEASEEQDLAAVEATFAHLQNIFGERVLLLHGKMKSAEKTRLMAEFKNGDGHILVATTVIEVGVDVPDATVIVIEQAERFGLAQLHQLRGRVGRGHLASTCILAYKGQLAPHAHERLATMRNSNDGFHIAEQDLKLRGGGEILGTRQSGFALFKLASLHDHQDYLKLARAYAKQILDQDPNLTTDKGQRCRLLLKLFAHDKSLLLLGG
jgi:ATP-dependent DNA helicase RecG